MRKLLSAVVVIIAITFSSCGHKQKGSVTVAPDSIRKEDSIAALKAVIAGRDNKAQTDSLEKNKYAHE